MSSTNKDTGKPLEPVEAFLQKAFPDLAQDHVHYRIEDWIECFENMTISIPTAESLLSAARSQDNNARAALDSGCQICKSASEAALEYVLPAKSLDSEPDIPRGRVGIRRSLGVVLQTLFSPPQAAGLRAGDTKPELMPAVVVGGGSFRLEVRESSVPSNHAHPHTLVARLVITQEQLDEHRGKFLQVEFPDEAHHHVTWNGISEELPRSVRFQRAIVKELHIEEVGHTDLDPTKTAHRHILEKLAADATFTVYDRLEDHTNAE